MPTLSSKRHKVEDLDAVEFCFQQGWTDGLPVIPPTEERVAAFLSALGRERDAVLGEVPERRRRITVEHVAARL